MNYLNKPSNNLGGISRFYLVPTDKYASISDPDSYQVRTLSITSFDTAWEISAIYQSIQYSEKLNSSEAGFFYDKSFTARIARTSGRTTTDLRSLLNRTWILIFQDQNGLWRVASNPSYPMRLEFSSDSGAKLSDLNHYQIKLKSRSVEPSYFISNPFL